MAGGTIIFQKKNKFKNKNSNKKTSRIRVENRCKAWLRFMWFVSCWTIGKKNNFFFFTRPTMLLSFRFDCYFRIYVIRSPTDNVLHNTFLVVSLLDAFLPPKCLVADIFGINVLSPRQRSHARFWTDLFFEKKSKGKNKKELPWKHDYRPDEQVKKCVHAGTEDVCCQGRRKKRVRDTLFVYETII